MLKQKLNNAFEKEYQKAIDIANRVLVFNPNGASIESNLALGYVLNNEYSIPLS